MGLHFTKKSMRIEALKEMIEVAQICIDYRKNAKVWGSSGCYGYPAAILLLAITDSIGSVVVGGNTQKHFQVLRNKDYYNLDLSDQELEMIYKDYRCLLTHNSVMEYDANLSIGSKDDKVFEIIEGHPQLNLKPFLILSRKVVDDFLEEQRNEVMMSNAGL